MKKEPLSKWTMAPGEEQILHRLPQKDFDALWPPGNAARHGHPERSEGSLADFWVITRKEKEMSNLASLQHLSSNLPDSTQTS